MAHLARTTPPFTDILECFIKFDRDSLHCLETSALIALSPSAVKQAQLSMSFGGLGLRSTAMHAPAAYIASVSHASSLEPNFINSSQVHLDMAVSTFNNLVPPSESISTADVLDSKPKQRLLSQKIEEAGFSSLIQESSTAVKARLRAVSQPQVHAWLRATPSPSLGLNLGSSEMQVLLKFWLGLPLDSPTDLCPFCSSALDAMGHHSLTCKHGGFVIARHNRLRDCLAHFCQIAGLAPEVEKGCNFGCKDRMRPADILVPNWSLSRPAAFDLKVINPLNSDSNLEASMIPGSTAEKGERDKHLKNDGPCNERG